MSNDEKYFTAPLDCVSNLRIWAVATLSIWDRAIYTEAYYYSRTEEWVFVWRLTKYLKMGTSIRYRFWQ